MSSIKVLVSVKLLILAVVCCSAAKSCPTPCDPMKCSTPGFPVLHYLLQFTQMHIHWVGDVIQPSHPLLAPSPPALNLSTYHIHLLIHYIFAHGLLHLPSTPLSLGMNDSTRVKKNGFWHIYKHYEVFTCSCFLLLNDIPLRLSSPDLLILNRILGKFQILEIQVHRTQCITRDYKPFYKMYTGVRSESYKFWKGAWY